MTERGFSLIELVVVVLLVGVLAAVAAPRLDLRSFDAAAAARELVEAIRYAQAMNMAQGGMEEFSVAIVSNGFQVLREGAATRDPFGNAASYQRTWSGAALGPTGAIAFDGRGRPSCTGALACSEAAQVITITAGASTAYVRLEPVTGFVR